MDVNISQYRNHFPVSTFILLKKYKSRYCYLTVFFFYFIYFTDTMTQVMLLLLFLGKAFIVNEDVVALKIDLLLFQSVSTSF